MDKKLVRSLENNTEINKELELKLLLASVDETIAHLRIEYSSELLADLLGLVKLLAKNNDDNYENISNINNQLLDSKGTFNKIDTHNNTHQGTDLSYISVKGLCFYQDKLSNKFSNKLLVVN